MICSLSIHQMWSLCHQVCQLAEFTRMGELKVSFTATCETGMAGGQQVSVRAAVLCCITRGEGAHQTPSLAFEALATMGAKRLQSTVLLQRQCSMAYMVRGSSC